MIRASGLSFRHAGAESEVLSGLSFQIERGQLIILTGRNGSGKSTLLALLAGIYRPRAGSLELGESGGTKVRVGLVPQDPELYILGSLVEEDLLLGLEPKDTVAREHALSLAARFGLRENLGQPVHTLSFGQKKKLSLASALAARPDILLLDEPFSGLDFPSALAMREALEDNRRDGLTQILCEHDLDLAADLADGFLLLSQGRLQGSGRPEEVFPIVVEHGVRPPCWWFAGGRKPFWAE